MPATCPRRGYAVSAAVDTAYLELVAPTSGLELDTSHAARPPFPSATAGPHRRSPSARGTAEGLAQHPGGELHQARLVGPDRYAVRLAELELLSAARIADLLAPGQVVLRLAVAGFGVVLPRGRGR